MFLTRVLNVITFAIKREITVQKNKSHKIRFLITQFISLALIVELLSLDRENIPFHLIHKMHVNIITTEIRATVQRAPYKQLYMYGIVPDVRRTLDLTNE